MAFPSKKAEMIGYRAAYICSSPDCNTLTVGPAIDKPNLKNKKGEAAHIIGAGKTSARYEKLSNQKRHAVENGIWLCASCHTLVDKNKGSGYPKEILYSWKEDHEEKISMLLRTHKSPMPLVVRHTQNFNIAQNVVDLIAGQGAFFQPQSVEDQTLVFKSIDWVRKEIRKEKQSIDSDKKLRDVCNAIEHSCRTLMNETSENDPLYFAYLEILRKRVATQIRILIDNYGCTVSGPFSNFLF